MTPKRWFDRVVIDPVVLGGSLYVRDCDCDLPKNHFGECKWVVDVEHSDGQRLSEVPPLSWDPPESLESVACLFDDHVDCAVEDCLCGCHRSNRPCFFAT
jgi:hypothetical protein